MRKIFLPILLIFFCSSVHAGTLTFGLQPKFSYYNGQQGEYVYYRYLDDSNPQTAKLSQLDWDLKNVFCLGMDFKMSAKNWHWSYGLKTAIPKTVGVMSDYDWKNVVYLPEIDSSYSDLLTNYTESKNKLKFFLDTSAKVGYKFSPDTKISFKPFFELGYRFIEMSAKGLVGFYGNRVTVGVEHYDSWDSSNSTFISIDENETVVIFSQSFVFTWIGLETSIWPSDKFGFGVTFALSPFLFAYSLDQHVRRSDQFHDLVCGFFQSVYVDFFMDIGFTKNDFMTFGVNLSISDILNGVTYSGKTGSKTLGKDDSCIPGEDFKSVEITLGYRHQF